MTLPKDKNLNGGDMSLVHTFDRITQNGSHTVLYFTQLHSIPLVLPIPFSDRFQVI